MATRVKIDESLPTRGTSPPRVTPAVPTPYLLSAVLGVVASSAALLTLLLPDLLSGPAAMVGSARGTALVVLVVAVPLMAASAWRASADSARALVLWLGSVGYLLYNAVLFLFATPFNPFFLLYVAMLGLSLAVVVAVLVATDVRALGARCSPRLPARSVTAYTLVVVALNAVAWLSSVVPAMFDDEPTAYLDGTGLTTNPVHVQDLAVWLPLMTVAAVWLWLRRPEGVLVAGAGLVLWMVESVSIASDQWFGATADPASTVVSLSVVWVFALLAVVGAVPVWALLRQLDRRA